MADAWEGLRVVNVSNPAYPVELSVCDTPGWALNVAVAGSTAYVADGACWLTNRGPFRPDSTPMRWGLTR